MEEFFLNTTRLYQVEETSSLVGAHYSYCHRHTYDDRHTLSSLVTHYCPRYPDDRHATIYLRHPNDRHTTDLDTLMTDTLLSQLDTLMTDTFLP